MPKEKKNIEELKKEEKKKQKERKDGEKVLEPRIEPRSPRRRGVAPATTPHTWYWQITVSSFKKDSVQRLWQEKNLNHFFWLMSGIVGNLSQLQGQFKWRTTEVIDALLIGKD